MIINHNQNKRVKNLFIMVYIILLISIFGCDRKVERVNYSYLNDIIYNNNYENTEEESEDIIENIPDSFEDVKDIATKSQIENFDFYLEDTATLSEVEDKGYERIDEVTGEIIYHTDRLVFVGDMCFSDSIVNAYNEELGVDNIVSPTYKKIIEESDFFAGNLECVLSDRGEAENKQWTFKASPSMVELLKDMRVNLVSVANNHSMDYGEDAFYDTLKILNENGIRYVGGGHNLAEAKNGCVVNINGVNYGFIAATAVVPYTRWFAEGDVGGVNNGYNLTSVNKSVRQMKKIADKVIVYFHWGVEKEEVANKTQQVAARSVINAGADLVIGAHPHVLQNIEFYKSKPIIYSLGNFIFGSTWTDTAMLTVDYIYSDFYPKGRVEIKLIPGVSGFRKAKTYWRQSDIENVMNKILASSPTCTVDEKGNLVEKINISTVSEG